MTYDGNNQTFEWDAANRLVAINYISTGDRTEFAYDGLNRRVKITEYGPGIRMKVEPAGSSYSPFSSSAVALAGGDYTLTFAGLSPNDNTVFIDAVKLNGTTVPNGGFETPNVGSGLNAYAYRPMGASWTFVDDAGVTGNHSGFTQNNPNAPELSQVGFLQDVGVMSQVLNLGAGTYTLTFQAAQRSGNIQQVLVSLQGNSTSVKKFVWCGNEICEERDANNTVTKRFFPEGEQRIGGVDAGDYYYTRDHLGSIREVTDSTGAVVSRFDYDAWGNQVVVSGSLFDFGFTGHYFHQKSGLNLAMYRAYNPTLGRWISRDPLEDAEMLQGANLYAYVGNNPLIGVDPLGLYDLWDLGLDALNFTAGVGNGLTGGGTGWLAQQALLNSADVAALRREMRCSKAFKAGELASLAFGVGRLAYAGIAKTASIFYAARGATMANAAAAVATRNSLKVWFRAYLWRGGQVTMGQAVGRYGTAEEIIAAAGRTNRNVNAAGGIIAGGSATTLATAESCDCSK
jgi:RHS repeat-associated protein